MSTNVTIPIAGFKDVYDVPAVEKALQELSPNSNEALRAVYEKMLRLGGQRFTVKPSALPEMEALFEDLPNFAEVLEDIRKHLALCVDSNDSIELRSSSMSCSRSCRSREDVLIGWPPNYLRCGRIGGFNLGVALSIIQQ